MPEYIAPGVFIEEVPFRSKSIDGVSTTTTGFVGPARFGPTYMEPDVVTCLDEFERIYGDGGQLKFSDAGQMHNYLWHAARVFFTEGGRRLYISRTFLPSSGTNDGIARANVPAAGGATVLEVRARFPGAAGNIRVRITVRVGRNVLCGTAEAPTVAGLRTNDVVWIRDFATPLASSPRSGNLYLVAWDEAEQTWRFGKSKTQSAADLRLSAPPGSLSLSTQLDPTREGEVRIVTLAVTALLNDGSTMMWDGLPPDPAHQRADTPDSLCACFHAAPCRPDLARRVPLVITCAGDASDGLQVLDALFAANPSLRAALDNAGSTEVERSVEMLLAGGNDGARPTAAEYGGHDDPATLIKTGLRAFEDIEDIAIVAAPGATFGFNNGYETNASTIASHLISHAERMRYRIAVLDSGDGLGVSEVLAMRAPYDSKCAAFYYPWARVLDPITGTEINLPPSGFVSGIFARNNIERAVDKAPATEVVDLALGLEIVLNDAQQDELNLEGINCFRFFPGLGFRLWGARTISSDSDWKYVNVRRYFAYLERSIDRGTRWAVFEPNGEPLWATVRRTIEDFLLNEWEMGALPGDKADKAFFVHCDRSTMTQDDLDNGRLVCSIGVAPLRPAEFVIFRIGQWTADAKC